MELFGFEFNRKQNKTIEKIFDDENLVGAVEDETGTTAGGYVLGSIDYGTIPKKDEELISTYRLMAQSPEVDLALQEIKNEVYVYDIPGKKAVEISWYEHSKISDAIRQKVVEEFKNVYNLLDFDDNGPDYFLSWYIDSRIFFHKVIEEGNKKAGIKRLAKIDPKKMKRVVKIPKADNKGLLDATKIEEKFIFTDTKYASNFYSNVNALELTSDSITYADSGMKDRETGNVIGHLYKAIVPFNNLRLMEDSLLIYRVRCAPERKIFYVDTRNLPKSKAESYLTEVMNRFRNKITYDASKGTIVDRKNILSMTEDYWIPRSEGSTATEVQPLEGGQNLGVTDDVNYFREKLYLALNVPSNRFKDDSGAFAFGKSTEIARDEYRFKKFLDGLRQKFSVVFYDLLKTQLILKNIISPEEWESLSSEFYFVYAEDNSFVEYKESEIINNRLNTLQQAHDFVGTYISKQWVMKNIMKLTDEEIKAVEDEKNTDNQNEDENDETE